MLKKISLFFGEILRHQNFLLKFTDLQYGLMHISIVWQLLQLVMKPLKCKHFLSNAYILDQFRANLTNLLLMVIWAVEFPRKEDKIRYRTRTIICRGLYIFYPIFHFCLYCRAVSITDSLCKVQRADLTCHVTSIRLR